MGTYNNLNDANEELKKKLINIGRGTAITVFNNIIKESVVDTGRFRGNWQVTLNQPATGIIENAEGRIEDPSMTLAKMSMDQTAYLTNNVPYAELLELGWSQKQPSGLVRRNVNNGQQALDEAVRRIASE